MTRTLAAMALALALGACTATATSPSGSSSVAVTTAPNGPAPAITTVPAPTDPVSQIKAFTLADLQAASADAHAQPTQPGCPSGDCTAYQCYDFLIATLPTLPGFQPQQTLGVAITFQKLRDLNNGLGGASGALQSLNRACAPLVIDTQTTLNRLGLIAGGAAATGGLLP